MQPVEQKLGYIIITFNGEKYLENLLKSIGNRQKIVIVDNASSDQTLKIIERNNLPLIKNIKNKGYAAAINQGIKFLQNDCTHFFILNQDTVIETKKIEPKLFTNNDITQPLILLPNEKINVDELKMNTLGFVYNKNFGKNPQELKAKKIYFFSGSAFIISKEVYQEIGQFDESLFMYYEDVDYAIRCLLREKKIVLEPSIIVKHFYKNSLKEKFKKSLLQKNRKIIINRYFTSRWQKFLFVKKLPTDAYYLKLDERKKFTGTIKPFLLNGFQTRQIPYLTRILINLLTIPYSWIVKKFI